MSKHPLERVELTNMCAVINSDSRTVLVQKRIKSWKGIAFPGGHVEAGESIVLSSIREIKEETGLEIQNLKLCGIKDWYETKENKRYMVFLYQTSDYCGQLLEETSEGRVFWTPIDTLSEQSLSDGFIEMAEMMLDQRHSSEFFYEIENKVWNKKFY